MTSTNSSSNIALKNNDETHDTIIFYVLLIFMIPSLISMMYLFIQFGRIRVLRTRVNNHLLLLLLIVNYIQVISVKLTKVNLDINDWLFRLELNYRWIFFSCIREQLRSKHIGFAFFGTFTISLSLLLVFLLWPTAAFNVIFSYFIEIFLTDIKFYFTIYHSQSQSFIQQYSIYMS